MQRTHRAPRGSRRTRARPRRRSGAARWAAAVALALCACGGDGDATARAEAVAAGEEAVASGEEGAASGEEDAARNVAAVKSDDAMEAPSWELPDLDGRLIHSKSYAGKTLVMDFWATWCPPCLFQIPILNSVQANHADDGVVVIGVAVDAEGAEVVKPYAEENGIEYQIVIGDEGLARKFGAPGFPALAVVRPDGRIDSMHVGLIEEAELEAAIAKGRGR